VVGDRQRDARVATQVAQLALVRERAKDDLITVNPTHAAVTCGEPSSFSVTT
jgi:hypothetical protein